MYDFDAIAKVTMDLLDNNTEWIDRYAKYADDILARLHTLEQAKSMFRCRKPFGVYISVSGAKNGVNAVKYSLRYKGQHIADLNVNTANETVKLNVDKKTADNNGKYFGYNKLLKNVSWKSEEAKKFREYFVQRNPVKKGHVEHMLESFILEEMLKNNKIHLRGIKPVQIGGVKFSMPTPLCASGNDVDYSSEQGGGIDIFTRCRTDGDVRLNVMELKDENVKGEQPEKVIKQAIKYAVFIIYLLRSKSGEKWWKLFGFNRKIPKHITVNATCLMPVGYCNDTGFGKKIVNVNGDSIELHYTYFDKDYNSGDLKIVKSSL